MKAEESGDRAEAARQLGNATAFKESCRELWTFAGLEMWWQDIRYAIRTLGRAPGFALAAIVALALGIGVNTAVFTIASGALAWNMGLDHVDRTVLVDLRDSAHREDFGGVSYRDFEEFRSQTKTLAGLAAYTFGPVNLSDTRSFPERYWRAYMSSNGFLVSEQKPEIGRIFTEEDEGRGAPPVAVLTHHVWQDRYGKDPAILGKTIYLDDMATTVIGVMPTGKRFPEDCDLWTPLQSNFELLLLFGRLNNGVDIAAARAELSTIAGRLAEQHPRTNQGLTAEVRRWSEITGVYSMRTMFAVLWVAVGFVLLIACADVANMLLARGAGRTREIAIRVAIGAGRARLVRQLLIESVLLSIAGGCLGWLVAVGGETSLVRRGNRRYCETYVAQPDPGSQRVRIPRGYLDHHGNFLWTRAGTAPREYRCPCGDKRRRTGSYGRTACAFAFESTGRASRWGSVLSCWPAPD